MTNIGKIIVAVQPDAAFLKEGIIISQTDDQKLTTIQFGIQDVRNWVSYMFVYKEDLFDKLNGIKKGDIKYFRTYPFCETLNIV